MTNTMAKTKREIIEYVVEHFRTHPRSWISKENQAGEMLPYCVYNGPDGAHCAFAICCHPIDSKHDAINQDAAAVLNSNPLGLAILLPEFRHILDCASVTELKSFYLNIQYLHDSTRNWTPNKAGGQDLTAAGIKDIWNNFGIQWEPEEHTKFMD
jgi:hypothetical protein